MTTRPHFSIRSRRGFTLLELLVATAVSAIVLLVINATFFGALRLSNTTRDHIAADLQLQRTLELVRRDLSGVMLPGVLAGQFQTTISSSLNQGTYGDQVGTDFYTNTGSVDGWNPFSEVQMVDYYLAAATDGSNTKSLIRVITRNLLPVQVNPPDTQTLLSGISEATIDYFDGVDWTTSWDSSVTNTLPSAIRFRLVLTSSNQGLAETNPIELVVPVVVSTSASAQAQASGSTTS